MSITPNNNFRPETSILNNNPKTTELCFLQINLRHCKSASLLLLKYIQDYSADVIMIQEPYAKKQDMVVPCNVPEGFIAHHSLDNEHQYGAVILVKNSIPSRKLPNSTNSVVNVKLYSGEKSLLLISAYCRPTIPNLKSILGPHLDANRTSLKKAVVCMDSNAKNTLWNSSTQDEKGRELESIMLEYSLSIMNVSKDQLPFVPTGTAFIDITLKGDGVVSNCWRFLDEPSLSDHPYILFKVKSYTPPVLPTKKKVPRTDQVDPERFTSYVENQLKTCKLDIQLNTEECVEEYAEKLSSIIAEGATLSKIRREATCSSLTPWWNDELDHLRTETRRTYKRWSLSKTLADKNAFVKVRHKYQRAIRCAKNKDWKKFVEKSMNGDLNCALKELSSKNCCNITPDALIVSGSTVSEPVAILQEFANHFFQKEQTSTETHSRIENEVQKALEELINDPIPPISAAEVETAAQKLKKHSAPGTDGINTGLLIISLHLIMNHLLLLFNSCLKTGIFPQNWKVARVRILRKGNKSDYTDVNSYRPISILNILSKLFEKIIHTRLRSLARDNEWINQNQHGFQESKSTETALHTLVSEVEESFQCKATTTCALIDIKSAFDTAWSPAILYALVKRRCPTYLLRLLKSFLNGRSAYMDLYEETLKIDVKLGCPQGSILSPFLWNALLDDTMRMAFDFPGKILAYADDLTLYATHKDPVVATRNLQFMVDAVKTALESIKLTINAKKTTMIVFAKRQPPDLSLHITVDSEKINPVSHTKLLGLTLDSKLTWKQHIKDKENASRKLYHKVRLYVGKTWGLSRYRLKTIYTAIVEPTFLYCCSVWASVIKTKTMRKKLRSIERPYNVMIAKAFKTADTGALSILAGKYPVDYRIQEITLKRRLLSNYSAFSSSSLKVIGKHLTSLTIRTANVTTQAGRKGAIRKLLDETWSEEWRAAQNGAVTRAFFPTPACFRTLKHSTFPQQITQILTGHCYLNAHQFRFDFKSCPLCTCSNNAETVEHFLFVCKNFNSKRFHFKYLCEKVICQWPPPISKIHKHPEVFAAMIEYVLSTDRLNHP